MDLSQSIPLKDNVMNHNLTTRRIFHRVVWSWSSTLAFEVACIFKINSQLYRLGSMALKSTFVKETDELTKAKSSMILTLLFWNPVECFLKLTNTNLVCTYRFPIFLFEILYQVLHNLERMMIERMNCAISFLKCNSMLVCKDNILSVAEQHCNTRIHAHLKCTNTSICPTTNYIFPRICMKNNVFHIILKWDSKESCKFWISVVRINSRWWNQFNIFHREFAPIIVLGTTYRTQDNAHETYSLFLLSSTLSSRTRERLLYFTFYELVAK